MTDIVEDLYSCYEPGNYHIISDHNQDPYKYHQLEEKDHILPNQDLYSCHEPGNNHNLLSEHISEHKYKNSLLEEEYSSKEKHVTNGSPQESITKSKNKNNKNSHTTRNGYGLESASTSVAQSPSSRNNYEVYGGPLTVLERHNFLLLLGYKTQYIFNQYEKTFSKGFPLKENWFPFCLNHSFDTKKYQKIECSSRCFDERQSYEEMKIIWEGCRSSLLMWIFQHDYKRCKNYSQDIFKIAMKEIPFDHELFNTIYNKRDNRDKKLVTFRDVIVNFRSYNMFVLMVNKGYILQKDITPNLLSIINRKMFSNKYFTFLSRKRWYQDSRKKALLRKIPFAKAL